MSLLTSLARASASLWQTSGDTASTQSASRPAAASNGRTESTAADGDVTLTGGSAPRATTRLAVGQYKHDVGQDSAFIKETLRHKLAEYGLNPSTRLGVTRAETGQLTIDGPMPGGIRTQIEQDLNNNQAFRDAFGRLSVNEPTLSFVDTALKLNKAYGVSNSLLDTMVSENQQFNGLQDLVHRYDSLRRTVSAEHLEAAGNQRTFAYSLNLKG